MNEPLRIVSPPVTSEIATSTRDFEDLVHAESAHLFGALCLLAGDRFEAEE